MESTAPLRRSVVKFRRIVFTLNNWTNEEYSSLTSFPCRWMVIGKENSSTGTPHLQGAIVLEKQMTLNQLKKVRGLRRAHLESMRGTPQQSLGYCMKEDSNAFQKGTIPCPGKRNDLKDVISSLRNGKTLRQLANDEEYDTTICRNFKALTVFRTLLVSQEREKPKVFWLHGDTGTGKTRAAMEFAKQSKSYWISNGSLKWFDGYCGEETAILDDIRSDSCSFDFLLRLLDRYPLRVEFKGGFVDWIPKVIILTCPMPPTYLFNLKGQGDIEQLERRIDHILEFRVGQLESNRQQLFTLLEMDQRERVEPTEELGTKSSLTLSDIERLSNEESMVIDLTEDNGCDTPPTVPNSPDTQPWEADEIGTQLWDPDDIDILYNPLNKTFY